MTSKGKERRLGNERRMSTIVKRKMLPISSYFNTMKIKFKLERKIANAS